MRYSNNYGGIIWTNHAIHRMRDRGLQQSMASETFKNPDWSGEAQEAGSQKFEKHYGNSKVTVIAKQNEKSEWIVISAWIDPPLPGSIDWKRRENFRKYQKAGFWEKMWIAFKSQSGF